MGLVWVHGIPTPPCLLGTQTWLLALEAGTKKLGLCGPKCQPLSTTGALVFALDSLILTLRSPYNKWKKMCPDMTSSYCLTSACCVPAFPSWAPSCLHSQSIGFVPQKEKEKLSLHTCFSGYSLPFFPPLPPKLFTSDWSGTG
jgi:hypothetical protein